ncbi:hypothetical protein K437DRAFT_254400 [Tilletiaria anomala UBC 951]|uniref:Uncharacterized protein n=1 Tax=Tilletiaria anomala (strain ATCC 24038 / CBS 436.72 / UBC 951) TaxID=1037660 RepID=A0A066WI58_TILAU|nr:uncharacterized protein K437DRAFT_254400 [Tilletiaria anomala UBC 951]KDN52218.1 hypothetical protein K437DRAFT_254400 [Tilletiaria anomala UBC 951]
MSLDSFVTLLVHDSHSLSGWKSQGSRTEADRVTSSLLELCGDGEATLVGSPSQTKDAPIKAADSHSIADENKGVTTVILRSGPRTDWWRTAAGCHPESDVNRRTGPSLTLHADARVNFTAGVWIRCGDFKERFQQGTLFVHAGSLSQMVTSQGKPAQNANWLKVGIEREGDDEFLGSVVCSPYSDWAIQKAPVPPSASPSTSSAASQKRHWIWVQVKRHGPDVTISYAVSPPSASASHTSEAEAPRRMPSEKELTLMREVKGFNVRLEDGSVPDSQNDAAFQEWRVGIMTCGPLSEHTEAIYSGFHMCIDS